MSKTKTAEEIKPAFDFLHDVKGINKATCYTDNGTYYVDDLAILMTEFADVKTSELQQQLAKSENSVKYLTKENEDILLQAKWQSEKSDKDFEIINGLKEQLADKEKEVEEHKQRNIYRQEDNKQLYETICEQLKTIEAKDLLLKEAMDLLSRVLSPSHISNVGIDYEIDKFLNNNTKGI